MIFLFVILYVVTVVYSLWAFTTTWRFDFDVDIDDLIFFSVLSLMGPLSVIVSSIVLFLAWLDNRKTKSTVIFKKF